MYNYDVNELSIKQFLERASINDSKRSSYIYKALHTFIHNEGIIGSAFVWLDKHKETKNIVTLGLHEIIIQQWLEKQLTQSLDEFSKTLEENKNYHPLQNFIMTTLPINNDSKTTGLWIIWANRPLTTSNSSVTLIYEYLKAITTLTNSNDLMFNDNILNDELIEAFQHKNSSAILAVLSLLRVIGKADLVYFGDIDHHAITITSHLGTKHNGFGFELPIGEGFGGKAAQIKSMLAVNDYQNSPYRVPEVSPVIDKEGLRSGLVFPIKDQHFYSSGLLYVTRRDLAPFSLLKQLTLLKIIQSIEPLQRKIHSKKTFFITNKTVYPIAYKKHELRKLSKDAKQIFELERWASKLIHGTVTVVDTDGITYNIEKRNEIPSEGMIEIKLSYYNTNKYGKLLYSSQISFQQTDWPDFLDDLSHACMIILERQRKRHDDWSKKYTDWVNNLTTELANDELYYTGLRNGFPVEEGDIWLIKWDNQSNDVSTNLQIQLMETALKLTKKRIIFTKNWAVIFMGLDESPINPERFRDEVLKILPMNIWLIHGATYYSFSELRDALRHVIKSVDEAMKINSGNYILEISHTSLDHLFNKENLRQDLTEFTLDMLGPLIQYDQSNHSSFTKTLAYQMILQSPNEVAKHLFIHKNTVIYRVKRAKEILNINSDLPKNRIALEFASYNWLKLKHPNLLSNISVNSP